MTRESAERPQGFEFDLDLVMLRFPDLWKQDRETALRTALLLLLDEMHCRARIEMLDCLEARAPELPPRAGEEGPPRPIESAEETETPQSAECASAGTPAAPGERAAEGPFDREIEYLKHPGLFPAVEQGLITPERLAGLLCDKDALWAAHAALTQFEDAPQTGAEAKAALLTHGPGWVVQLPTQGAAPDQSGAETVRFRTLHSTVPATGAAQPSLTALAHAGRWDELEPRLRIWLPHLLEFVGLPENLADKLLQFVQAQLPEIGSRRFSEILPEWLDQFAQANNRQLRRSLSGPADWENFIEPVACRAVLEESQPDEPQWAKDFRATALQSQINSMAGLVNFQPADQPGAGPKLDAYRRELLAQVSAKKAELKQFFERNW